MRAYFGVSISNEGMHNDFTCIVLRIKSILYTVRLRIDHYMITYRSYTTKKDKIVHIIFLNWILSL
jgi:hypothetical protein